MTQILVIDSDHETCQLLYRALTSAEHKVKIWKDDLDKLTFPKILMPTIVIVDWKLQNQTQRPTIWQELKENPALPPIFCLMLTSQNDFSECMQALGHGADDFLSKPINLEELQARIMAAKHILSLKKDLQLQKQLLETELSEAQAYVRSLLPNDLDEKIPIKARFIPSRMLGGDCYDYYWLDPDYLAIYVLDVSGHGLGSALLSTSVLNLLRSQSLPNVNFYRPEKVLIALNETFQMNDQNEKYFTIWYGVYNRANRQLLYSSAGHPPGVLVSNSEESQAVKCLKTSGFPIGMLPDVQYKWQRCYIPPESKLYLFSDGAYEIRQLDNTMMGLEDFVEILAQQVPEQTIDDILSRVSSRAQSRSFSDDLSLLEIQLK